MNYQESIHFLYSLGNEMPAAKFDLENIRRLCAALGNPERQFASVLIAGTNGKGSTAATLYSILLQTGWAVGCYTSPHLVSPCERIRVGQGWISEEEFAIGISRVAEIASHLLEEGLLQVHPTFFEVLTAATYSHMAAKGVRLAVLEVGMGGRLDATNISCPIFTIITSLGMDHQQYLGSRLEEIAAEKAGILRPQVPILLGPVPPVANRVVADRASDIGAPLLRMQETATLALGSRAGGFQSFDMRTSRRSYHDLCTPLRGPQQVTSTALAVIAAEWIDEFYGTIATSQIHEGVRRTIWPGRIQVVREQPRLILDGAHNPDAAENLARFLKEEFPNGDLVVVFGVMRDKDYLGFGQRLFPLARKVLLTQSSNSRSASVVTLVEAFSAAYQEKVVACSSLTAALAEASKLAHPGSWIVVTGSLYLVGEAMRILGVDPLAPPG